MILSKVVKNRNMHVRWKKIPKYIYNIFLILKEEMHKEKKIWQAAIWLYKIIWTVNVSTKSKTKEKKLTAFTQHPAVAGWPHLWREGLACEGQSWWSDDPYAYPRVKNSPPSLFAARFKLLLECYEFQILPLFYGAPKFFRRIYH